jgi:hypothetical protein
VKSLTKRRTLQKREPSVLKACSRVQDNKREKTVVATQFNSPFSKFNDFCNTDDNKIGKKPKEQALQDGSKELTLMSNAQKLKEIQLSKNCTCNCTSICHTNSQKRLHQQCSKSTPPLAINYRRNKHSRMPVMTVHDKREKMNRISPLLVTTELPTEWTGKKRNAPGQMVSGKVLLPTHAAESVEQVLYCLTEFNSTAVRKITSKTVTT